MNLLSVDGGNAIKLSVIDILGRSTISILVRPWRRVIPVANATRSTSDPVTMNSELRSWQNARLIAIICSCGGYKFQDSVDATGHNCSRSAPCRQPLQALRLGKKASHYYCAKLNVPKCFDSSDLTSS